MTSVPPPPENPWPSDAARLPDSYVPARARPPFSKTAVAGFIISCVGLVVFAMAGPLGAALSGTGLRRIRERGLRGRGLAIAGIIIGVVDFASYLVVRFLLHS
ncbi:DUF4190 domain-containing protein [Arthrobacter sp. 92]|uniref:DUF4190 domain-containing protein n=1 Tax=Arthrobacter sp. 92 TaxID=3418175 RepID=UPI003D004402